MKVSIIIPSYNYGKYIGETLKSLIAQTYQNWECIVIDDGSKDDTRQVVNKFAEQDERIKYFYQDNAGQASARNHGLRFAKGKYIQFLDADDLLEFLKLERHVVFLEAHSEIDLVYGESRYFRSEFLSERRFSVWESNLPWMSKISGGKTKIIEKLIEGNIFTVSSPLVRKTAIEAVGEFDMNLVPIEDWDYWMRCAIANVSMQYLEIEGTRDLVRIHALSSTQNLRRGAFKRLLLRRKFARILPDNQLRAVNAVWLNNAEYVWIATESFDGVQKLKKGKLIKGMSKIYQAVLLKPSVACQIFVHKLGRLFSAGNVKENAKNK